MSGVQGLGRPGAPAVKDGVALVSAPLLDDPTSQAAFDTVDRVRARVHALDRADALVGGSCRDLFWAIRAGHDWPEPSK